ncbi:MAG: hypothetical protein QOJ73_2665 [Streptosporangiaceae bacterium]|nr:hypothetical protein [Streptosporangiaceae bacterium]
MKRVGTLLASALVAGCGTVAAAPHAARLPSSATPSLATSEMSATETWAVVVMGGSSAAHNNFWQLFTRSAKAARWTLATPPGVADNGGLAVADAGPGSLVTAVRPSQDLTFTPLSASRDEGAHWSQGGLLSASLAGFPDVFAAAPGGRLLALTRRGDAQVAARAGATWTSLASERSVAASPAGRACGLARLTAVAFSPTGVPLLAGQCTQAGTVGIFASGGGTWRATGPALPPSLARRDTEVLGLASTGGAGTGGTTAALLQAGSGAAASLVTAWSADGGRHWRTSVPFGLRGRAVRSAAFGAGGAIGVTLTGGAGAVAVTGPGAAWRSLPPLPAGAAGVPAAAATLAAGPGSGFEALIAHGGRLSVWQQTAGGTGWEQVQVIKVAIPYGSSG